MSEARICAPVCVGQARKLRSETERAASLAEFVELRFDCLEETELDAALLQLEEIFKTCERALIVTFRPKEQGGMRELDPATRERFWLRVAAILEGSEGERPRRALRFFDVEFDDGKNSELIRRLQATCDLVCSHHDFQGAPANLSELYARMRSTGARIVKLAVTARDAFECLPVFKLLEEAKREGGELIALAMGDAGAATRIIGPSRGAYLTFGALDATKTTAPGQTTAEELRELYRVGLINEETFITGVIGSPVSHSLSPHMHNAAFAARNLNAVYVPLHVSELDEFITRMARPRTREMDWPLRGLSVTAPHKSSVLKHLDWMELKAREIGAANTIVFAGEELHGYNTDAEASLAPLQDEIELRGARAAVIGAGGAARALLWALKARGAQTTVFARDIERARETASHFGADAAKLDGARFDSFDLVVNATPLGARGKLETETPAEASQLRGARIAYDLVYNPERTRFLEEARASGCKTFGGLDMLVSQAAAQFKLWTGEDAPVRTMRQAAEKELRKRK